MNRKQIKDKLLSLKCENEMCAGGHNFYINSDDVVTVSVNGVDLYFLDGFKKKFIDFSEIKDVVLYSTHITFVLENTNIAVERW